MTGAGSRMTSKPPAQAIQDSNKVEALPSGSASQETGSAGLKSASNSATEPSLSPTPSKVLAADVKRLREETGCGMQDAKRGLELRGGDYDLAKEWVLRHNLAAVMSDEARFPLYHASACDHAEQQFGCYACLVKARSETTQTDNYEADFKAWNRKRYGPTWECTVGEFDAYVAGRQVAPAAVGVTDFTPCTVCGIVLYHHGASDHTFSIQPRGVARPERNKDG